MTHLPNPLAVDVLHDLNQSLALIAGFVELAEEALLAGDAASARARLTLAAHAAQHAQATAEAVPYRGVDMVLTRPLTASQLRVAAAGLANQK